MAYAPLRTQAIDTVRKGHKGWWGDTQHGVAEGGSLAETQVTNTPKHGTPVRPRPAVRADRVFGWDGGRFSRRKATRLSSCNGRCWCDCHLLARSPVEPLHP
jgi:hypothetical protein